MDILFITLFIMVVLLFVNEVIKLIINRKKQEQKPTVTYSHYLLYDEDKKKYIIKEFDDSIIIVGTYYNTQNGAPLLIVQTQGWVPKPNSLGSKISHYQKESYVVTDEYIFTNEESAILAAIKLNNII